MELLSRLTPTEQKRLYQFVHKADGSLKAKKWTKEYVKKYQREWFLQRYENDEEFRKKQVEKSREWRKKNPDRCKVYNERRRMKRRQKQIEEETMRAVPEVVEEV